MLILEESVVDLGTKRLVSLTRNIDHKKLVVATETIEYIPSRDDPAKTVMTRRTSIRSSLGGLMGRMIERVCHALAIRNVKRMVQVKKERERKGRLLAESHCAIVSKTAELKSSLRESYKRARIAKWFCFTGISLCTVEWKASKKAGNRHRLTS